MIPKMWLPSPLILATGSMNDTSHSPRPSDRLLRPCEVQRYLRATSLRLADARPVEKVGSDGLHICGAKKVNCLECSNTNRHELERAWSYDQRAYPLGYIPAGARERTLKQIQQSTSPTARAAQPLIGGGPQWINFGPAPFMNAQITPVEPTSGRIVSI